MDARDKAGVFIPLGSYAATIGAESGQKSTPLGKEALYICPCTYLRVLEHGLQ